MHPFRLTWRNYRHLLGVSLILLTGCMQPETSIKPPFTPTRPTPMASATAEPTATSTIIPTPLITPVPGPPPYPPLPSTNVFASLVPEGAYSILGIGKVVAAAASPDESLTALTTPTGLVMLDTQSFAEVWSVSGDYAIGELEWSPDGSKIAINTYLELEVRDVRTGALLHSWNAQDIYGVYGNWGVVSWSPDSSFIALVGFEIRIWNIDTGELVHQIEHSEEYYAVYDLAWSPDGTRLAAGVRSTEVERAIIWDTKSGEILHQIEDTPMNWSDDLSLLLTWNHDAISWAIWDLAAGEEVLAATGYAQVSPDWSMVAVHHDSQINIYDTQSGSIVYSFRHPTASVFSIEWSPDNTRLAAFYMESAYVWELQSGELVFSTDQIRIRDVGTERGRIFSWHPDSQKLITGVGGDSGLVVWDIEAGGKLRTIDGEVDEVKDIAFLSDGKQLLYHFAHGLSLWDMQGFDLKHQLVGIDVYEIIWSEDGSQLATLLDNDLVVIWDVETTTAMQIEPRDSIPEFHFGDGAGLRVNDKVFSPDGRFYATQYTKMEENETAILYQEGIAIWDAASDEMVKFLESRYAGEGGPGYTRVWSPDGSLLAATIGQDVYIWNVDTGELIDQKTTLSYDDLAFSPDGSFLAANAGGAVILWEITD